MVKLRVLLVICAATAMHCAPANGQQTVAALRAACADDAQRLCAGVQLGGGRMVACLKEHKDQLSDKCKQAAGVPVNPNSSPAPSASSATPASGTNVPGAGASVPVTSPPSVAAPNVPAAASAAKPAPAPKADAATAASSAAGEKFVERII